MPSQARSTAMVDFLDILICFEQHLFMVLQVAAAKVGELLAVRAAEKDVSEVHWIRKRGQRYHGKIASLIESMQAAGLPLH